MVGSGTTLVEAQALGRRIVGCDIDPLARLITRAKLTPLAARAAGAAGRRVLTHARRQLETPQDTLASALDERFDAATRRFVDYWFLPEQQFELHALAHAIEQVSAEHTRRYLQVVFSSTIIAKSGGASLARDLAHTRPHRDLHKTPRSAVTEFERLLQRNLRCPPPSLLVPREETQNSGPHQPIPTTPIEPAVRNATATATGLPDTSIDLVVTSPPYANGAIDYMRAHKFSLVWLGWKIGDLTRLRRRYVGHDAILTGGSGTLPDRCEQTVATLGGLDMRKAAVLRRYFTDMLDVLCEMERVLRSGGAAVFVIGSSVLRGLDVETHRAIASLGEAAGFQLAGVGCRRLDRDRRMMPARWGSSPGSQIERRMHEEFIVGLVKP